MDQIDFANNFMRGNLIYFIAFLTEVITKTIEARDKNKPSDVFQIISHSAERRMGLPVDIEQHKTIIE